MSVLPAADECVDDPVVVDELNRSADRMAARLKADPLMLSYRGIYAGWDGRFVKIGITAGSGAIGDRLATYRTHNPSFRLVGMRPAEAGKVDCYADLERQEHDLCARLTDSAITAADVPETQHRPCAREWFRPTLSVLRVVVALEVECLELVGLPMAERRRFFHEIKPRRQGARRHG